MSVCPVCGEGRVVPIVFGLPSPELFDRAVAGEVVLGGCVMVDGPHRAVTGCRDCDAWFRADGSPVELVE